MKSKVSEIILEGLEKRLVLLNSAREAANVPARGWLRAVREAVGITQREAAEKAAVTRQSYAQFEDSEQRGSISIASLRRAAGALDCELVYFVVPRRAPGGTFRGLAGIHDPAARHLKATEHSMALGGQGAARRGEDPQG